MNKAHDAAVDAFMTYYYSVSVLVGLYQLLAPKGDRNVVRFGRLIPISAPDVLEMATQRAQAARLAKGAKAQPRASAA